MPKFNYVAMDSRGKETKGVLEVGSQAEAINRLKQLGAVGVPYKSSPQSVSDIVAGHVNMAFAEAGLSLPMIRDGKLAEPLRGTTLSGNLFTTLENIDMIGRDFEWTEAGGMCGKGGQSAPVGQGSPYIRIQNALMGGK